MELSDKYLASVVIISEAGEHLVECLGLLSTDKNLKLECVEILDSLANLSIKLMQKALGEDVKSGKVISSETKKLITELEKKQKQIAEKHKVRM